MTMENHRVLIAAATEASRAEMRKTIEAIGEDVVGEAQSGADLLDKIAELKPQIAILDAGLLPLPGPNPISIPLLAVVDEIADAELITTSDVFGALCRPVGEAETAAEIRIALERFAELRACRDDLNRMQTRLADRVFIERAKGMLMQREGMNEDEAFKQIHFTARKANRTMRDVAEEVIGRYREQ